MIFEAVRSTLLAIQGDKKLPSLKTLQAEQHRLLDEQQRLYDERAKLKKEARIIDTMKANVDDFPLTSCAFSALFLSRCSIASCFHTFPHLRLSEANQNPYPLCRLSSYRGTR